MVLSLERIRGRLTAASSLKLRNTRLIENEALVWHRAVCKSWCWLSPATALPSLPSWQNPVLAVTARFALCYLLCSYEVTLWLFPFFFLIGATFFPQELKLIAVWHESKAARTPSWYPKGDGGSPTAPAWQLSVRTSYPARKNPAENSSRVFWRRVRFLLVVTPWASSLWGLMRTHPSIRHWLHQGVAQAWWEDAREEVVAATC